MSRKNLLIQAPPYEVESAIKRIGADLRTARIRRKLTIHELAEKIGTGTRAVADAEKGKLSTGIGIYVAMLWALDLIDQLKFIASPTQDKEGQILALSRESKRARRKKVDSLVRRGDIDDDF